MANYKQSDYEALRRRCVELSQAGWQQAAIADAFGLTQPWVSRTLKKYNQQGLTALQEGKRTGAPARLSAQQLSQLVSELNKGAEYHGFSGAVWTRPRVNEVIKKLFGVSYDPSQIGRILKKVGWSRQLPQRKASQQDARAVAQWREERLAELKKAHDEERVILYVDESACYLLPLVAHTWAPRGQTPILVEQAGRTHLSLIAAIAPNGRTYLAGQNQPFTGEDIVWFLNQLCGRYRKRNMLIIWDGAAIHRSEAVKQFLHERPGRIHLDRLPAYSPELNPVELLWSQLKGNLKNRVFTSLDELTVAVLEQAKRFENDPKSVKAFFNKKEVAFITE